MKRFKNILFVVEPEKACKPALERAVKLAENNQARLTVVDVVERVTAGIGMPLGGPISADLQAAIVNDHACKLEAIVEPFHKRINIDIKILVGVPFLEIIRDVLRSERDLVIKMPEHLNWSDRMFGSDDMHLFRKCPCPVWLIKHKASKSYRRILAAVDVADVYPSAEQDSRRSLNQRVLKLASSEALAEFAELHIVHVWRAIGEDDMRNAFLNTSEEKVISYVEQVRQQHEASLDRLINQGSSDLWQDTVGYLKPKIYLVKGWAQNEVPALANRIEADLVVMGTVGRIGLPGFFMGNTAETILNQIECSVLAIKPQGFITPVTLEE